MRQVDYLARVSLASGRIILLDRYEMSKTYAGLIEGAPTAALNDQMLRELADGLTKRFRRPVHIIDPPRQDRASPTADSHPSRRWQLVPGVRCVAVFDSAPIDGDLDPDVAWSSLVIAWFQNDPQFPVGPDAMPVVKSIDWESLAVDCWD